MSTRLATLSLVAVLGASPVLAQESGAEIFAARCAACHQPGGAGLPGIAPPLASTLGGRLAAPAGRAYLAQVVVSGMTGMIEVHGVRYTGAMPSFANLPDAALAAVLNHVLEQFNAETRPAGAPPVTVADIVAARVAALRPHEVRRLRNTPLAGGAS